MSKLAALRWVFLLAAAAGGARCLLGAATAGRLAFAVACASLWFWLSRRKVLSLDRSVLGIPPRR
ncbi:MAG: hypothetical protein KGJ84_04770 [Elusimicrobia bacterium]|nr:hypothetical protein [Elusimicrobiota bacterium]